MNLLPPISTRLLVRPQPAEHESLRGFVARAERSNGGSSLLRPFVESLQTATTGIPQIAVLTGCSEWHLKTHGSYVKTCIWGGSGVLFGTDVLSANEVWLGRRMVCPMCIVTNTRISNCCWELSEYDVCHIHSCYLVGNCSCGRKLSWHCTSQKICPCGVLVANIETQRAPQHRGLLCELIFEAMAETLTKPGFVEVTPGTLTPLNWFLIYLNFIRLLLLPKFFLEDLRCRSAVNTEIGADLLLAILKDREYCHHLQQVILLHAAKNPTVSARTLRLASTLQATATFFRPCLRDIVIHDRLLDIKNNWDSGKIRAAYISFKMRAWPKAPGLRAPGIPLRSGGFTSKVSRALRERRE